MAVPAVRERKEIARFEELKEIEIFKCNETVRDKGISVIHSYSQSFGLALDRQ